MKRLAKYFFLFQIQVQETMYYPSKILLGAVFFLIRTLILFSIYSYTYTASSNEVQSLSVDETILSITLYFLFFNLGHREVMYLINEDVYSGQIELWLTKPMNYITTKIVTAIAASFWSFVLSLIFFSLGIWIFFPSALALFATSLTNLEFSLQLLSTILLSFLILLSIYTLIGLASVWFMDAKPLQWIVDKSIMIFGGAYLPLAFFPYWFRFFALISPFGAGMLYTSIFSKDFQSNYLVWILIQIGWAVVLGFSVRFVYNQAVKKLSLNGG